jgi:excisionase family DNA binding protein
MPLEASRLLTSEEVAAYLQVPVRTIHNWRSERKGPRASKVGRHLRFRRADVEAWLDQQADAPRRGAA